MLDARKVFVLTALYRTMADVLVLRTEDACFDAALGLCEMAKNVVETSCIPPAYFAAEKPRAGELDHRPDATCCAACGLYEGRHKKWCVLADDNSDAAFRQMMADTIGSIGIEGLGMVPSDVYPFDSLTDDIMQEVIYRSTNDSVFLSVIAGRWLDD